MSERRSQKTILPSKGKFYPDGMLDDGEIEVYPIRVIEEKILAGATGTGTSRLNLMLSKCIATPDIDPKDLLMVDRMYLLFFLSMISYGSERNVWLNCTNPQCGDKFEVKVNMAEDFEITYADDEYQEPFIAKLPVSGDEVGMRHLRGHDEAKIVDFGKMIRTRQGKKGTTSKYTPGDLAVLTMILPIVNVNGQEMTQEQVYDWAQELIGQDADFIRSASEQFEFGIDMEISRECTSCGMEVSGMFPSESLFRFL